MDWLIEVQENFELFHETLYLAVQITDHYLAVTQVKKNIYSWSGPPQCSLLPSLRLDGGSENINVI